MAKIVDDELQDLALTWSGRAMDIGLIETQLGKLRYLAAGKPDGGEGFAIRASLLNMVVYAEHDDSANHASHVIEDLSTHHPSRALIVLASPSEQESHIEAQLAAHCHITPSLEQNVCCEEITLKVSGKAAEHLHSVIVPLLVPDLPVYVWWAEQLPDDMHLFHELMDTADHFIVDSARADNQPAELVRLAALSGGTSNATLGDLTWDRLVTWRDLFRRQRQITEMRHHLTSVQSIEISYANGHGDAKGGKAFLMLAWIGLELGWDTGTVEGSGPGHLSVLHRDKAIDLHLRAVDFAAIDPGELVSIEISCQSETAGPLLSISRTADPNHLTIRTEHKSAIEEQHVRTEPALAADLLRRELDAPLHGSEFSHVLEATLPLIRASRGIEPAAG